MWNAITGYANSVFEFILQGNPPQEVIPLMLLGIGIMIAYIFVRMSKGDVK